jgi:flagellar basal body-associated protein FliL
MKRKTIIIIIAVLIAAVAIWYFFFNSSSSTSTGSSSTNASADAQYLQWIAYAKANGWTDSDNDGFNKSALYQCRVNSQLTNPQLQYLANKYNGGTIV